MDIVCSNCGYIWENISQKIVLLHNNTFRCKKCSPYIPCNDYYFVHDKFELGWKYRSEVTQYDDEYKMLKSKKIKSFNIEDNILSLSQSCFYIDKSGVKHTENIKSIITKDLGLIDRTKYSKNTYIKCNKCNTDILTPIHVAGENLPPLRCNNCNPSTNFTKYKWDGRTWRCINSINDIPLETIRSYLLSYGIKCKNINKDKLLNIIKDIDINLLNINKYLTTNNKIPSYCHIKLINSIPKNKDLGFIIRI
jgi:hypothetical protein